ncbi:MAG: capsule assembly Wzi family protein, partial [Gemmatimonadota bacterium]
PWPDDCAERLERAAAAGGDRVGRIRAGPVDVAVLPARWLVGANTGYPADRNDGALWEGRGLTAAVRAGVALRLGPVTAAVEPLAFYQQNRPFPVPHADSRGFSTFADPQSTVFIDRPQRPGTDPVRRLDPGQSYVRLDAFGLAVGLSTENLWWGPALQYPLVMSSTAPGFPHAFLGTSRPVDVGIGRIHGEVVWGHLSESGFYDDDPANDRRLLAGLAFEFHPRGLDGLAVGATRAFLITLPPDGLDAAEYVSQPYTGIRDNPDGSGDAPPDNQLFSVFLRWALPESGFEVYGEWAREDHWIDYRDFMFEPDHAQAHMAGLQQAIRLDDGRRLLRLRAELASLGNSTAAVAGRGGGFYYRHSRVRQGYTHRGQLLGAWIGPRSADAQRLAVDLLSPDDGERIGAFAERVRRDPFLHDADHASVYGARGHDLELTAGLRGRTPFHGVDVTWETAYGRRWNREFMGLGGSAAAPDEGEGTGAGSDPDGWRFRAESNLRMAVGLAWLAPLDDGADDSPRPAPDRP